MAPAGRRSLYIGATNTVLGIAMLSTSASGVFVETLGYQALFGACLAAFVVAGMLSWRIAEPGLTNLTP
jgi:hypothetical protein